jgi:hypothetical protein
VLALAVFASALLLARAARPDRAPGATPVVERLAPPVPVEPARTKAALPALGKAPVVPDLKRTPEPTAGGGPAPGLAAGGSPPVPSPQSSPGTAVAPPAAPSTGAGAAPAPSTGGGSAGGGSGDGGVICSPC